MKKKNILKKEMMMENSHNGNNYPLLENIKISYINPDKINLN